VVPISSDEKAVNEAKPAKPQKSVSSGAAKSLLRLIPGRWAAIPALMGAMVVFLIAIIFAGGGHQAAIAASCGSVGVSGGNPTPLAQNEIPADYLQDAQNAEQKTGVPWNVLMGISHVESTFGRSTLPGVHSGSNSAGAAGPMQIGIGGAAGNTWGGAPRHRVQDHHGGYAADGDSDGWEDVYDPADAILGAAKYLKANGAPADLHRAIFAYNHLESYVAQVMNYAHSYASGGFTVAPAASGTSSGPQGYAYVLGDSIALGAKQQLKDELSAKFSNVYVDASVSRSITTPGITPGYKTSGLEALQQDAKTAGRFKGVDHASVVVVELGTNDLSGGLAFEARIQHLIGKIKSINANATIYWVETFSRGPVNKVSLNNSIESESGSEGYQLVKTVGQGIQLGSDGVHPTPKGSKKFAQVVASQVSSPSAATAGNCDSPVGSGNLPGGNAQDLAKAILTNHKIITDGRLVYFDLHQQATGGMPSNGAPLKASLLAVLEYVGQSFEVHISALESGGTGHHNGSAHYSGRAMDINIINGSHTTGRDANAQALLKLILPVLPKGSGVGQLRDPGGAACGPMVQMPPGVIQFDDTCNHLHVQVP
jgi:lysophospholipase L1-like esterase